MVKREPTSPLQTRSSKSGKRSCMDGPQDQAPTLTSPMYPEESEGLQDMWDEPPAVLKDTWAVTRCVNDHGNTKTRWTAGHLVAVAMWSDGLEAGIQAAKAIRIFGIWSPHADHRHGEPPPLSRFADRSDILDRLWPTVESKQDRLLNGQSDLILEPRSPTSRQLTVICCINASGQISPNFRRWCGQSWIMAMVLPWSGTV